MTVDFSDEELAARAKALTPAQRRALTAYKFTPLICEARDNPTKAALGRKGLCEFTHRAAGRGDWKLTPLGAAIRNYLQKAPKA